MFLFSADFYGHPAEPWGLIINSKFLIFLNYCERDKICLESTSSIFIEVLSSNRSNFAMFQPEILLQNDDINNLQTPDVELCVGQHTIKTKLCFQLEVTSVTVSILSLVTLTVLLGAYIGVLSYVSYNQPWYFINPLCQSTNYTLIEGSWGKMIAIIIISLLNKWTVIGVCQIWCILDQNMPI